MATYVGSLFRQNIQMCCLVRQESAPLSDIRTNISYTRKRTVRLGEDGGE